MYVAALFLRLALGAAFLSAVSSRFGVWPKHMGGGSWTSFLEYTAELNPWAPSALIPFLGSAATAAEFTLGILLVIGFRQRLAGVTGGILLLIFALSMINGTGIKSPLDYSVFTASAAAFVFATIDESRWSLDSLLHGRTENKQGFDSGLRPTEHKMVP